MNKVLVTIFVFIVVSGCEFELPGADQTFGTQNFVSAISIIELHNIRNGEYPNNLKELEFLGDWDGIWLSAVRYEKNGSGYNLYLERGWVGKPSLEFPLKFKTGLGIKETNIKWIDSGKI
jgi:hypothetical protein